MFSTATFQFKLQQMPPLSAQEVVKGDFNGDGILDLLIPYVDYSTPGGGNQVPLPFFLGTADGKFVEGTSALFGAFIPTDGGPGRTLAADFNGDGKTDLLLEDGGPDAPPYAGGHDRLFLTTPAGMVEATANLPAGTFYPHGQTSGDVNGDGKTDIILFNIGAKTGGAVQIWIGDGAGKFTWNQALTPPYYQGTGYNGGSTWGELIDVNGDRAPDLIAGTWDGAHDGSSNVAIPSRVFLSDGKGFGSAVGIDLPRSGIPLESVMDIVPIDLNGDGRMDMIFSETIGGGPGTPGFYSMPYLQFLINDGGGKFHDETAKRYAQPTTAQSVEHWIKFLNAVDVNGDGALDLLAVHASGVSVALQYCEVLMNDGRGNFTPLATKLPGYATALTNAQGVVTSFAGLTESRGTRTLTVITNDIAEWGYSNVARSNPDAGQKSALLAISNQLNAGGMDHASATAAVANMAVGTTAVAALSYQFFTGKTPSAAGLDYLISPTSPNTNNLNSAYYQTFNVENRFINFAVNLGVAGEGAGAFQTKYGALNLLDATKTAYATIFGAAPTDAKAHALIDSRTDYFAYYGKTDIGTKAAMVGWLLAEAEKAHLGSYAKAGDAFLADLVDHGSGAQFNVDLIGAYGSPSFIFSG